MKYIGIGTRNNIDYGLSFYLFNRMLTLVLWTKVGRRPKYYFYNKVQFEHCIESEIITPNYFLGILIK